VKAIQAFLGHRRTTTTLTYLHIADEQVRAIRNMTAPRAGGTAQAVVSTWPVRAWSEKRR
jgi:hypothetical protein